MLEMNLGISMQEQVYLKDYTTFKLGGPASYFFCIRSREDLTQALQFAQEKKLPWFVLGGGSNIVVRDEGYSGVVLKMEISGIEAREFKNGSVSVVAGAGELFDGLVAHAVTRGWYGLENLSYIPGTVGAAPIQNIGAYGAEICQVIDWVEVWNPARKSLERMGREACHFGYRTSVFKEAEGQNCIVLHVGLTLTRKGSPDLRYKDVAEYFATVRYEATLQKVRQAIGEIRLRKFPDLKHYGTAGSYFKNPIVTRAQAQKLQVRFPDLPVYEVDVYRVKLSLAWILDHVLHLKGVRQGMVGTFERQPLVLINFGGATTRELSTFAKKIVTEVHVATGIRISLEVILV